MRNIYELAPIRTVLELAERSLILESGYHAIAMEVTGKDALFEGTILYVPGIHLSELKAKP